jgi:1,2-diacylglycerol 3-alpha-glucosyltransferase
VRIAHFCDSQPGRVDGVSASAGLSVRLLREAGHDVVFYTPGRVRTVPIPFRDLRLAAPWLAIDPGPVDVIHAHTTGPIGMAGFRLARDRGVPLVVTWHTDLVAYADHFVEIPVGAAYCARRLRLGWTVWETLELAGRRRRERLVELGRGMMSYASVVLAPSEKTAAALTEFGALPPVRVVPTPVAWKNRGGRPARSGAPLVLSVGRVTGEKNPGLLIRAFDLVRRQVTDARLIVVGVKQGARPVEKMIRELNLGDAVRLLPPVPHDEVAGYYRAADVLAFASLTDTQSLVLAEAESLGLPVVMADRALAAETPWRTSADPTPESLAAAIVTMLTDDDLRERTRKAGLAANAAGTEGDHLAGLLAAYEATLIH